MKFSVLWESSLLHTEQKKKVTFGGYTSPQSLSIKLFVTVFVSRQGLLSGFRGCADPRVGHTSLPKPRCPAELPEVSSGGIWA